LQSPQYSRFVTTFESGQLEYSIFSYSGGARLDSVEMHVLARAYHAAWRSVFARDPTGPHFLTTIDVLVLFEAKGTEPGA
jgi:hypothetical protein